MKLTDLGTLPSSLSPPPEATTATTASRLFAKLLVSEVRKTLPEGGLLGGGHLSALESVLDEALADSLTTDDALGIEGLFDPDAVPRSAAPVRRRMDPARLVDGGRITSRFGQRIHPIHRHQHHHDGVDIAAREGSPVRAAASGTVIGAGYRTGYGNVVVVDHGQGRQTRYAHCRDLAVVVGDRVAGGDRVGTVGQTGRATGPHLHFEVRQDGIPVDPDVWAP